MNLLYFVFLFPLVGSLLLMYSKGNWSENNVLFISLSGIGLSLLFIIYLAFDVLSNNNVITGKVVCFHKWLFLDNFYIPISFVLDYLSLSMLIILFLIGFFVCLYAAWYMQGDYFYTRFFVYINLFIISMTILILADNLLLMYVGWESVGLCSYLLIGFYFIKYENGFAALRVFIITRLGDIFLICGLFILYVQFGTLSIYELSSLSIQCLGGKNFYINCAALFLLGGAIAKSAQFPLHQWLADAMVAPTPASALIHSATMVTAGIYLIVRMYNFFLMTPNILEFIGFIGSFTLFLSGLIALIQVDIKRILAYSTISQLGYMFLAIGVYNANSAIFHLIIHAFFKSLLFLSAGSIIISCKNEQNIFSIGKVYNIIPLVYICFVLGGMSLSSFPFITSGFYSKESILWSIVCSKNIFFIFTGFIGSFITVLYIFRVIFIIFYNKQLVIVNNNYGIRHNCPLWVLLILSTYIGVWFVSFFPDLVSRSESVIYDYCNRFTIEIISFIIIIIGIIFSYFLWFRRFNYLNDVISTSKIGKSFTIFLYHNSSLYWLYKLIIIRPYLLVANLLAIDPFNKLLDYFAIFVRSLGYWLSFGENGQLHWYVIFIICGSALMMLVSIFI